MSELRSGATADHVDSGTSEEVPAQFGDKTHRRAKPSRGLVFGIVAIALFMGTIDLSIVATALPEIGRNLRSTVNWTGWIITIYGLGLALSMPIAGRLSDQFGRRRVFLVGVVLFAVSSLACGFATNIYMLIAFRGVQALGGGSLQPSAAGIVADHFGRDRDRAIGMFGTVMSSGQVIGPLLGGILVHYLSWRWIFFVNVPIGVALFVLVVIYIPESRKPTDAKTDVVGIALGALFILSLILSVADFGEVNATLTQPSVLVPAICMVALLVLFMRHTNRAEAPFIPRRLLHRKGFGVVNLENFFLGAVALGTASLLPLYAENRYHLSVINSGTLLTARAVGSIAIGAAAAMMLRRTGFRLPLMLGFGITAVGWILISFSPQWGMSPYAWLSVAAGLTGLGLGAISPAARNAAIQLAPDDVAAITGLRSMFAYTGAILSISIVTAILNRSTNPGLTQSHVFWVIGGIAGLIMVPLVFWVPEHKGTW